MQLFSRKKGLGGKSDHTTQKQLMIDRYIEAMKKNLQAISLDMPADCNA